jgi:hypothetical protein
MLVIRLKPGNLPARELERHKIIEKLNEERTNNAKGKH